jgi:hypothetical protein
MVTRMTNAVSARMADDAVLPLRPDRYVIETRRALEDLKKKAADQKLDCPAALGESGSISQLLVHLQTQKLENPPPDFGHGLETDRVQSINQMLLRCDRSWLFPPGLPARPWFQSTWAASDEDSGYAAWTLPLSRRALAISYAPGFAASVDFYTQRVGETMSLWMRALQLGGVPPQRPLSP